MADSDGRGIVVFLGFAFFVACAVAVIRDSTGAGLVALAVLLALESDDWKARFPRR